MAPGTESKKPPSRSTARGLFFLLRSGKTYVRLLTKAPARTTQDDHPDDDPAANGIYVPIPGSVDH